MGLTTDEDYEVSPCPSCGKMLIGEYGWCPYCNTDLRTDYEREADEYQEGIRWAST